MILELPTFLVAALMLINGPSCDDSEVSIKDLMLHEYVVLTVDWDDSGRPALMRASAFMLEPFRHAYLVEQEEIQKELELTGSQINDIDKLFQRAYRSLGKLRETYPKLLDDPQSFSACRNFYDQNNDDLSEILIPTQADRLEQIYLRLELRRRGVIKFLSDVAPNLELTLSTKQLEKVKQIISQFNVLTVPELTRKCEDRYSRIFGVLDRRQRRLLDEFQAQQNIQTSVDIIAGQLDYALQLESTNWKDGTLEDASDFLANAPVFRLYVDGRFEAKPSSSSVPMYWQLKLANEFQSGSFSSARPDHLSVDPDDLASIQKEYANYQDEVARKSKEFQDTAQTAPESEMPHLRATLQTEMEIASENLTDAFFESLSSESERNLKELYMREAGRSYGPVALILVGPLGSQLEVTDPQKEAIRKAARQALDEISEELAEAEEQLLRDVNDVIGSENEKKLKEALGPRLQHVTPNLTVLTSQ